MMAANSEQRWAMTSTVLSCTILQGPLDCRFGFVIYSGGPHPKSGLLENGSGQRKR